MQNKMTNKENLTLVIGATGKTGRRVAERLAALNVPVRLGSRSGEPPFEWEDRSTWAPALNDVTSAYVVYYPDLAVPDAPGVIEAFAEAAVESGVRRLVLLSGRGEEGAERCERIVQNAGIEWTVLRASWFSQNFSEGAFLESVMAGAVALPVGEVKEPFIDVEDIADVAVAALTEDGHTGRVYELTGPRLMTFAEAVGEIAEAAGREIEYRSVPHEVFMSALRDQGIPEDVLWLMDYLFTSVLDGRNAHLSDGVQRALGREASDFSEYVTRAAGAWREGGVGHAG